MAIVKNRFTRQRRAAKANVRYITHRAGREGETITRELFGHDDKLTKEQAYTMIDSAPKGTYFNRLKLSTDPRKEDWDKQLNLREVAKKAVRELEIKLTEERGEDIKLDFIAAIHDDHTNIRHVHILAFSQEKLTVAQLKALTAGATTEARAQRKDLDRAMGISPNRTYAQQPAVAQLPQQRGGDLVVGRPGRLWKAPEAPPCPRCDTQMTLFGTRCLCPGC